MNKKGFTLIEIIVCIILIVVIGTGSVVGINYAKNSSTTTKQEKFYKQFDEALEVYLSEHPEIYKNLEENVEGAIVTLEVLKNEGLVKDNQKDPITKEPLDYKNNYYVLADAVLLEDPSGVTENTCDGQVSLEVIKRWEILSGSVDTSKVMYICPKSDEPDSGDTDETEELKKRIESLEKAISNLNLGTNNWVLFDVDTNNSKTAYFPSEDQDLWKIVSSNAYEMKLVYSNYVNSNNYDKEIKYVDNLPCNMQKCDIVQKRNNNNYTYYDLGWDVSKIKYIDTSKNTREGIYIDAWNTVTTEGIIIEYENKLYATYRPNYDKNKKKYTCNLLGEIDNLPYRSDTKYGEDTFISISDNGWTKKELLDDKHNTTNSKKKDIYDAIKYNNFIKSKDYYYEYGRGDSTSTITEVIKTKKYNDKLGTLSILDDLESLSDLLIGKSFYVGIFNFSYDFNPINGFATLSNGSLGATWVNQYGEFNGIVETDYLLGSESPSTYSCYALGKGQYIHTANYIPVVTISYNKILRNFDAYSVSYKNKFTECNQEKLGSKECPFLIKLDNTTLSWN